MNQKNPNNNSKEFKMNSIQKILAIALLLVGLVGCTVGEVPDSPTAPGGVAGEYTVATDELGSWANPAETLTIFPDRAEVGFDEELTVALEDSFVWNTYHIYSFEHNEWQPYQFMLNGNTYKSSGWIKDSAINHQIGMIKEELIGDYIVAAYSCQRIIDGWDCHGGWQVEGFSIELGIPDTPGAIGGIDNEEEEEESTGDYTLISTAGDDVNIGDSLGQVKPTLDNADLPNLLADGEFEYNQGNEAYDQELNFNDENGVLVPYQDEDDGADEGGLYIHVDKGNDLYSYTLEFDDSVNIGVTDEQASLDLNRSILKILGDSYTVISAKTDGAVMVQLNLLRDRDSAEFILENGQEVRINGVDIDGSTTTFFTNVGVFDGFEVTYQPEDDTYLAEGDGWVDPVFGQFEIKFEDIVADTETIYLELTGDDGKIIFRNNQDRHMGIPIYCADYCDSPSDRIGLGDDSESDERYYMQNEVCSSGYGVEDCEGARFIIVKEDTAVVYEIDDIDVSDEEITITSLMSDSDKTTDFTFSNSQSEIDLPDGQGQVSLVITDGAITFVDNTILENGQGVETLNEGLVAISTSETGPLFMVFFEGDDGQAEGTTYARSVVSAMISSDTLDEELIVSFLNLDNNFYGPFDASDDLDTTMVYYTNYGSEIRYDTLNNQVWIYFPEEKLYGEISLRSVE